jgi:hypothetical protein
VSVDVRYFVIVHGQFEFSKSVDTDQLSDRVRSLKIVNCKEIRFQDLKFHVTLLDVTYEVNSHHEPEVVSQTPNEKR